MTAKARTRSSQ